MRTISPRNFIPPLLILTFFLSGCHEPALTPGPRRVAFTEANPDALRARPEYVQASFRLDSGEATVTVTERDFEAPRARHRYVYTTFRPKITTRIADDPEAAFIDLIPLARTGWKVALRLALPNDLLVVVFNSEDGGSHIYFVTASVYQRFLEGKLPVKDFVKELGHAADLARLEKIIFDQDKMQSNLTISESDFEKPVITGHYVALIFKAPLTDKLSVFHTFMVGWRIAFNLEGPHRWLAAVVTEQGETQVYAVPRDAFRAFLAQEKPVGDLLDEARPLQSLADIPPD